MSNVLINLKNKMWQLAFGKSLNMAVTGLVTHHLLVAVQLSVEHGRMGFSISKIIRHSHTSFFFMFCHSLKLQIVQFLLK